MNRPIIVILIGYIIGILWGLYFKISIVFLYAFLALIYIIINYKYKKKKFKILSIKRYFRYIKLVFKINIILIITISSFISNNIVRYYNNKYSSIYQDKQKIKEEAIVISNKIEKDYMNRYKIKINNMNYYLDTDKNIDLEYGDKIEIKGEFQEPQTATNHKAFDYKEYLKTLKIYGTIDADRINLIEKSCGNKFLLFSNNIFVKIKGNIENTYSEEIKELILGVMLGDTTQIDSATKEDFSESNISHVLAISGMHISYIIYLVTNSTQGLLGKRKSKIITSFVLFFYMSITGFSISIVRAGIMGIINCMGFVLYRKSNTLNNIAIAALILLINNPFCIQSTSFLLTYGGTLGIVCFNPIVQKMLKNIRVRNRKWKYIFIKIQRKSEKILETISVTISAQIVILPIMMLKFNSIGIGFLITNLLLSFVIGIIVMGGFIQILISFISINLATYVAKIIQLPVYVLILISKIQLGNFKVVTPDLYQIILYYLSVFLFKYLYKIFHSKHLSLTEIRVKNIIHLIKYKIKPYKVKMLSISAVMLIIIFFVNLIPHNLKIFFIDVGQGDSTLIITPNDKTILIDGGGSQTYDVGKNTLVPYLLDRKIKCIDFVLVSHADQDHIGGIITVLEELKVKNVIVAKQGEKTEQFEKLINISQEKKINVVMVEAGDKIIIDKNVYFEILWPTDRLIEDNILNNNSIVAKLVYCKFSMLFTGDIEKNAEKQILRMCTNKLNATILKVAHHGSKTSSIQEFLNKVNPQIALIGVGENNKFGHPNDDVLKRLKGLRYNNL